MDRALLVMAHKAGLVQSETENAYPELADIPFESERSPAASLNQMNGSQHAFVKWALEKLQPLCRTMAVPGGEIQLDPVQLEEQAFKLASRGYRVIALAAGPVELAPSQVFSEEHLTELTLLGLSIPCGPRRK